MKELLACQTPNNQDVNSALSAILNKQLMEAKSSKEDAFVAAMFRAAAFLVTSKGTQSGANLIFIKKSYLSLNRVRTGHGKPRKSWNFRIQFSQAWKVMEFKCGLWKVMFLKKYKINWERNSKNVPKMKDDFQENGQI